MLHSFLQGSEIKPEQVKGLRPADLQKLSTTQIASMPPEVVKNLSTQQLQVNVLLSLEGRYSLTQRAFAGAKKWP